MARREGYREGYDNLSRREIASMLVHCVYFRDLRASRLRYFALLVAWVLGYKDKRPEHYGKNFWTPLQSIHIPPAEKLKELGVAFYFRGENHPPPRLVIALRGTLLHRPRDLKDDVRILKEELPESERVRQCQDLIEKVVTEFQLAGEFVDDICIAGHSLGAAIALLVGKHLAAQKAAIDTHLFAPPLLTLDSIPRKLKTVATSTVKGWQLFFTNLTERMREGDVGVVPVQKKKGRGRRSNAIVETVAKNELDEEWTEFLALRNWVPHFYLNRDDIICNEYIQYYEEQIEQDIAATRHHIDIPEGKIIDRLFGKNAKYITNVVPSANLYVSNAYQGRPLKAHSLKQWHKFTDAHINVEASQARLLDGYKPHTLGRMAKYVGQKVRGLGDSVVTKAGIRHHRHGGHQ